MLQVIRPTKNKLIRGYSAGHKGYDFAGLNLPSEVLAGRNGTIIQVVNLYTNNWINNGKLTTRDYGNYIKIRNDDQTYCLYAHLAKNSMLKVGTVVKMGQRVAHIGNTGNSTGPHLHAEYRDKNNVCHIASFDDFIPPIMEDRRPLWFDLMNKVIWKKPHEELNDEMIGEFVDEYPDQLRRSGCFDKVANFLGYTDTRVISEENIVADIVKLQKTIESNKTDLEESLAVSEAKCQKDRSNDRTDLIKTFEVKEAEYKQQIKGLQDDVKKGTKVVKIEDTSRDGLYKLLVDWFDKKLGYRKI